MDMRDTLFERSYTPDGIEVITEAIDGIRSVSVGIWIAVGSRDEAPCDAGMSHFLEHMMFKGTPTRTAQQISEHFERIGAEINAFTSKEYTCYYTRVLDTHASDALDVLADMVARSLLAEDAIRSEREVVLEEIARRDDAPDDAIHDLFVEQLMGSHPLGRPVLGTRETVASFDRERSLRFRDDRYVTGNVVVAAAGHLDHGALLEAVSRTLTLRSGTRTARPPRAIDTQHGIHVVPKDTEQAHICWGVEGLPARSEQRFVLAILDSVLGGGMASRLFQEIREKRGMAYSVYSYHNLYTDTGQLTVYAGTRPGNTVEVIRLIRGQAGTIAGDGITADELDRAKESIKGQLVLALENSRNRMTRLGKAEITGSELLSTDEVIARVDAVTLDEVNDLARTLFSRPETITVIGPVDESMADHLLV